MYGNYQRSYRDEFDADVCDPWILLAYYETVLSRLPHHVGEVKAGMRIHDLANFSVPTVEELRARMTPAEHEDVDWLMLTWLVMSAEEGTYDLRIDLMLDQSPPVIDIEVSGPTEAFATEWLGVLRDETRNAKLTARDQLPLPAKSLPVVAPIPTSVDHPNTKIDRRKSDYLGALSVEVIGGALAAGLVALAAFVWSVFLK